jgi:hypothetical protein
MSISARFAFKQAQVIANSSVLPQLMETAPQTVLQPISFQLSNLHSFDQPLYVFDICFVTPSLSMARG